MKNIIRVVVIAALVYLSCGPSTALGQFFFMENQNIGKEVPDFTLKTLTGDKVNLKEFRDGKRSIIFFWATWCPHCRVALEELNKNKEELLEKQIKLVLVDIGEDQKIVNSYIQKQKIEFDVFLDEETSLAEPYGLIGVPTFFFVDERGIVKDVQHSLPEDYEKIFVSN